MAQLLKFKDGKIYGRCNCCGAENVELDRNSHIIPSFIIERLLEDEPDLIGFSFDDIDNTERMADKEKGERRAMHTMQYKWCTTCEKKSAYEDDDFYGQLRIWIKNRKEYKPFKLNKINRGRLHKFVVSILIRYMMKYGTSNSTASKAYLEWTEESMTTLPIMVELGEGKLIPLQTTSLDSKAKRDNKKDTAVLSLGKLSFVIHFGRRVLTYKTASPEDAQKIDDLFKIELINILRGISSITHSKIRSHILWGRKNAVAFLIPRESTVEELMWVDITSKNFVLIHEEVSFSIMETSPDNPQSIIAFIKEEIQKRKK